MTLGSLLEAAETSGRVLSPHETMVLALAWAWIEIDGEEETEVVKWARRQIGCKPTDDELRELHVRGMSVREIADACGMSKSNVARRLSLKAA